MHKSWCPTLAYADPSVPAQAVNDLLDFVDGVKDIEGALEITKSFNYNADSVKALLQCSDPLSESWCSFERSEFASAIQTNQGNLEAVAICLQKYVKSCAWYFYHKFRPAQRRKDTTLTHYHDEFCYICYGEDTSSNAATALRLTTANATITLNGVHLASQGQKKWIIKVSKVN